jgi:hypothetical protein
VAHKLVVEIVGDASSLQKSYATAARSTKVFGREIEHATRGTLSGTGAVRGLGRSLAFASGGFLAFAGVSSFLTDSIKAAREAGVAQRSLAAQMKTSGESFRANREEVEKVALSYGKFGFQNDEVIQSLTILERGTGRINTAIKLQGLTADIARAKNIDLASAASVVAKVFGGQETALRRAVPGLEKNAHGWDLIRLAQRKMAGQAAANTTVSERFAATLHDTEEIIGTALLPILNKYLTSLSKWLEKMNQSGQLQKNVTSAVNLLKSALGAIKAVIDVVRGAFELLNKITGSTKHSLELLIGAFLAFKGLQLVSAISGMAVEMGILSTSMTGPAGLVAAAGAASYALTTFGLQATGLDGVLHSLGGKVYDLVDKLGLVSHATSHLVRPPAGLGGPVGTPAGPAGFTPPGLEGPITADAVKAAKRTAEQRNAWFDAMIGRRELRAGLEPLKQQLAALDQVSMLLTKRIAITKDITRKLNLEDQLLQVNSDRAGIRAQLHQQMVDQLQAQAEQAKAAREAAQAALEARQFRGLGLGPGGEDLPPTLAALKKQLTKVRDAVKGTILDTRANRGMFANITSELAGHFGKLTDTVKQKIKEMLDNIDQQLGDHASRDRTRFSHINAANFVASLGLNLTPEQARRLQVRISQVGAGGTVPGGRTPAFAGVTVNGDVHVHGVQDTKGIERELHRRAKARASTRRGAQ